MLGIGNVADVMKLTPKKTISQTYSAHRRLLPFDPPFIP
jgi:hypothetical protein